MYTFPMMKTAALLVLLAALPSHAFKEDKAKPSRFNSSQLNVVDIIPAQRPDSSIIASTQKVSSTDTVGSRSVASSFDGNAADPMPSLRFQQKNTMTSGISVSSYALIEKDDQKAVPMKEIVCVNIFDPMSKYPPFEDRALEQLPQRADLYVTFRHGGKYWGRSIPFAGGNDAWVNIPLLANATGMQEPVQCEVKQPMGFSQDKTLFKTQFFLDDGSDHDVFPDLFGEINSILRDPEGNDSGLRLKIRTFSTDWDPIYVSTKYVPPKLDSYFTLFLKFLSAQVKALNLGGASVLTKPRDPADKNLPTLSLLGGRIEIPKEDEFIPLSWKAKYVVPVMNRLPVTNKNNPAYNRPRAMNRIRLMMGDGVTTPYEGKWYNSLSDASMHRVYFSSLGMFYIQKDHATNGYFSDLTYFNKLKYKDSYDSLGCKTFFDANGDITMIEDSDGTQYHPGHKYWEWAKLKSRSAIFTLAALEHVTSYHYTWSSTPGLALRMFLPPTHPIRMAFSAHMFRTHYTTMKAKDSLLSEVGVLGRILPFAYEDGLEKAYMDLLDNFTFTSYPDELAQQGLSDCPFHVGASDGMALHKVLMDYVSNLFDEVYGGSEEQLQADLAMKELYGFMKQKMRNLPNDFCMANLKLVWGEVLFRVTGAHTSIGNVVAYAVDPLMINFRLKVDEKGEVVGSDECNAGVAGVTALTLPDEYPKLSQDWSQVLSDPNSPAYAKLRSDLEDLGNQIDSRNKAVVEDDGSGRRYVNRDFHPAHAALSSFS